MYGSQTFVSLNSRRGCNEEAEERNAWSGGTTPCKVTRAILHGVVSRSSYKGLYPGHPTQGCIAVNSHGDVSSDLGGLLASKAQVHVQAHRFSFFI